MAPAIIDHQPIQQALQSSGVSPDALLTQTLSEQPELHLPPDFRLRCLHGRHSDPSGEGDSSSRAMVDDGSVS